MKPAMTFTPATDGFFGAWYPAAEKTNRAMIVMLGDSSDDYMAKCGAKWLNQRSIHVLAPCLRIKRITGTTIIHWNVSGRRPIF